VRARIDFFYSQWLTVEPPVLIADDRIGVPELALCGRGAMEFVSEVEHMKVQVMRQLQKALEPAMTNAKLRLISRDGSDKHWRCTSRTIRPIFSGIPFTQNHTHTTLTSARSGSLPRS
jgi:hypothetical protein